MGGTAREQKRGAPSDESRRNQTKSNKRRGAGQSEHLAKQAYAGNLRGDQLVYLARPHWAHTVSTANWGGSCYRCLAAGCGRLDAQPGLLRWRGHTQIQYSNLERQGLSGSLRRSGTNRRRAPRALGAGLSRPPRLISSLKPFTTTSHRQPFAQPLQFIPPNLLPSCPAANTPYVLIVNLLPS
jgi:hypothetical protein